MKSSEIMAKFERVKDQYTQKDDDCLKRVKYMRGEYFDNLVEGSTIRDEPKYTNLDGSVDIILNLPQYAVQDAHNLCARDPDILVPPKDDKSERKALKNRKAYIGMYESSGGNWLMQQSSYYEILHGWGIWGALPDLAAKKVKLVSYQAPYCYPVFKLGSQTFLRELYVSWQDSPEAVKAAYPRYQAESISGQDGRFKPGEVANEGEGVTVLIYYDKDWKLEFADGQLVRGVRHNWGFVPFMVVPFQQAPGTLGMGIADQIYGLCAAVNKEISLLYQALYENVNSDTVIYSDDDWDIADRNGRKYIQLSPGDKMEKSTDDVGRVVEGTRMIHDLLNYAGILGSSSASRQGRREGMYISSAYSELSRSLGDKLDNYLRVKGARMSQVFEFAARLAERHFHNTKMEFGGHIDGAPFYIDFKGKDFDKYYRVDVTWPPSILNSANSWLVQWLQLNSAKLASDHTTRTKLGGLIQDPEFEKRQIEEEAFDKAKLDAATQAIIMEVQNQMALQQQQQLAAIQPPQTDTGPESPDVIPFQKKQLEKGRTNETAEGLYGGVRRQSPPVPPVANAGAGGRTSGMSVPGVPGNSPVQPGTSGPPLSVVPSEAPAAGAGAAPDSARGIIDALREVKKVKGSVYLVGEAVAFGAVSPRAPIELAITNPLDKQTLINGATAYRGRLKFIQVDGMPPEPHIHVFDDGVPSKGYEVMGGDESAVQKGEVGQEQGQVPQPLGENLYPEAG